MSLRAEGEANLGQPAVASVIVRSTHNYSLKWKVHAVNFVKQTKFVHEQSSSGISHVALRAPRKDKKEYVIRGNLASLRYF